jgi:hypothetical protein
MPSNVTDIQNIDPEQLANTYSRDKQIIDEDDRAQSRRNLKSYDE